MDADSVPCSSEPGEVELDEQFSELLQVKKELAESARASPMPSGAQNSAHLDEMQGASPEASTETRRLSSHAQSVFDNLPSQTASTMRALGDGPGSGDIRNQLETVMKNLYSQEVHNFEDRLADARYTLAVIEADRESLMDELAIMTRDRNTLLEKLGDLAQVKTQLADAMTEGESLRYENKQMATQLLDAKVKLAQSKEQEDDVFEEVRMRQHEVEMLRRELKDREEELFQVKITLSESLKARDMFHKEIEKERREKEKAMADRHAINGQKQALEEELRRTKEYLSKLQQQGRG